jgi:hypothetical protein
MKAVRDAVPAASRLAAYRGRASVAQNHPVIGRDAIKSSKKARIKAVHFGQQKNDVW